MTTQSPSQMAASTMESPTTLSMNNSPSPVSDRGKGRTSSTTWSANIGDPAAMRPTTGTLTEGSTWKSSADVFGSSAAAPLGTPALV